MDDLQRYRQRSLWLDGALAGCTPRPALEGEREVDVAIAGAGFTGLWTAYALALRDPGLRIAIVEAETVGYGASGRNGGFVSAGISGEARVYERRGGRVGVERAERAMIDGIDWIGEVVERESIGCGWVKGGAYRIATSPPQLERVRAGLQAKRDRGFGEDDVRYVTAAEIAAEVRVAGALGGTYTPHCARVDPALLARGLAEACERRGVTIYERSPATSIEPGRIACARGSLRAAVVVRATEAFTTRFPARAAHVSPARLAHARHRAASAARLGGARLGRLRAPSPTSTTSSSTRSGRPTTGSRSAAAGSPTGFGGGIREEDEVQPRIHARLEQALRRLFPAAAEARITHRWGGFFAAPRDWSMSIDFDRASGLAPRGRVLGPRRRRVEPRRPHARRPDHRDGERAHDAALGRPREQALGARAAAVRRRTRDRGRGVERRPGGGPDGSAGAADRARAEVAAGALAPRRKPGRPAEAGHPVSLPARSRR